MVVSVAFLRGIVQKENKKIKNKKRVMVADVPLKNAAALHLETKVDKNWSCTLI